MAKTTDILIGGVLTQVTEFDHTAQEIDDAVSIVGTSPDETRLNIGAATNPNLLDNWYFVDPIDERGGWVVPPGTPYFVYGTSTQIGTTSGYTKVSYFDVNGYPQITVDGTSYGCGKEYAVRGYVGAVYTIDRWKMDYNSGATSIELTDEGLHFINSVDATGIGAVYQMFDEPVIKALQGQTVTASMLGKAAKAQQLLFVVDGSVLTGSAKSIATTLDEYTLLTHTITLPHNISSMSVFFYGNSVSGEGEGYIKAVKLELGSTQTLAHKEGDTWVLNDPPPNKQQELAKCQRYQYVINTEANNVKFFGQGAADSAGTGVQIAIPIPNMRAYPALNPVGTFYLYGVGKNETYEVSAISVFRGAQSGQFLVKATSSGLTAGATYQLLTDNNSTRIILDSNL